MADDTTVLEQQIGQWRGYAQRHRQLHPGDLDELEDHLRGTVAELATAGLHPDEAFLVAVKRMGSLNELSREFSRAHSERLWKQLVLADGTDPARDPEARRTVRGMLAFALLAALVIKIPALFGQHLDSGGYFYSRNLALFALAPLIGYFAWQRRAKPQLIGVLVAALAIGAAALNAYPFHTDAQTLVLAIVHLVLALWLLVGLAYVDGDWRNRQRWMDFIRYTGEMIIYSALITLGGIVLVGIVAATFKAIGVNAEAAITEWILPCGGVGALIVAAWLVEAKQSVVENMAPVLTRVFTPLFTLALVALLIGVLVTDPTLDVDRNVLITFNVLLVVVLGLVLYSLSARDPEAPPGLFDKVQLALIIGALAVDALVLVAVFGRTADAYGFTANRTAALGQNIVLLANLAWSAVLLVRFMRGRIRFAALERWQTSYIPVYAVWASFVVLAFPPIFGFA